ncbi:MAG: hypothetical protein P4N60_01040 [Verrucomicrobiae bacterium]|nr:hypothetical protein [Verrucomicrobiae bacterium]
MTARFPGLSGCALGYEHIIFLQGNGVLNLTQKATDQLASIRKVFAIAISGDAIRIGEDGIVGFSTTTTKHLIVADYILARL